MTDALPPADNSHTPEPWRTGVCRAFDADATAAIRERALRLFAYDMDTGVMLRRTTRGGEWAGSVAGSTDSNGYRQVKINNVTYQIHRLAFLMVTGRWPTEELDHKDGDRANNRFSNLRKATRIENRQNMGIRKDSTSGVTGVSWCKRECRWMAVISVSGKRRYVGRFTSLDDAVAARSAAKASAHSFHPAVVGRESSARLLKANACAGIPTDALERGRVKLIEKDV